LGVKRRFQAKLAKLKNMHIIKIVAPLQISTGFGILAALLHGTLAVGVSQTLRR